MYEPEEGANRDAIGVLGNDTWDAVAELVGRHTGVWGGFWFIWLHTTRTEKIRVASDNRALKHRLVHEGRARTGSIFDGATAAVAGARRLIARAGGGVVEACPQDTHGTKVSSSFLYNGTRGLFEQAGVQYERPKGKSHTVTRKVASRR